MRCSSSQDATLERRDNGVTELLLPYFGGICFRYGFEQAIEDGVCAPPRVALVGVELSVHERAEYVATEQQLVSARQLLHAANPPVAILLVHGCEVIHGQFGSFYAGANATGA